MKNRLKNLICLIMTMFVLISFIACSSQDKIGSETSKAASDGDTDAKNSDQTVNTKYGEAEVYQNDKGMPSAKTESGEEVELTTPSLEDLMGQYDKVKGSGSEDEKELLDKIQLILDVAQSEKAAN